MLNESNSLSSTRGVCRDLYEGCADRFLHQTLMDLKPTSITALHKINK